MTTEASDQQPVAPVAGEAETQAEKQTEATPQPAGGRSAEARELERQLDEAREQLRQAEERARENLDRWQRAQADLANYRRRAQYEREEQEKYAVTAVIAALLPVLDSFDRAWQTLPGQLRRLTWLSGVAMIHSQLRGTFERLGLVEIEADDQPFDPTLHEAVDSEPSEGPPHVVAVLQAGYKLHDRVLRPTLVKVGPKPGGNTESPESAPKTGADAPPEDAASTGQSATETEPAAENASEPQ